MITQSSGIMCRENAGVRLQRTRHSAAMRKHRTRNPWRGQDMRRNGFRPPFRHPGLTPAWIASLGQAGAGPAAAWFHPLPRRRHKTATCVVPASRNTGSSAFANG